MKTAGPQFSLKLVFVVIAGCCGYFALLGSMIEARLAEEPVSVDEIVAEAKKRKAMSEAERQTYDAQRQEYYEGKLRRLKATWFREKMALAANGVLLSLAIAWPVARRAARWKATYHRAARLRSARLPAAVRRSVAAKRRTAAARRRRFGWFGLLALAAGFVINFAFLATGREVVLSWRGSILMPEPGMRAGFWETPEGKRWHDQLEKQWNTSLLEYAWRDGHTMSIAFRAVCVLAAIAYAPTVGLLARDIVRWRRRRRKRRSHGRHAST